MVIKNSLNNKNLLNLFVCQNRLKIITYIKIKVVIILSLKTLKTTKPSPLLYILFKKVDLTPFHVYPFPIYDLCLYYYYYYFIE